MISDLERALDTKIIPWTIVEYKCRDFWIFLNHESNTPNHLVFVPVCKNLEGLVACYSGAYKWGYDGVNFDKWTSFKITQVVDNTMKYPCVHMIPT